MSHYKLLIFPALVLRNPLNAYSDYLRYYLSVQGVHLQDSLHLSRQDVERHFIQPLGCSRDSVEIRDVYR